MYLLADLGVDFCSRQFLQNFRLILFGRFQELGKVALCQHGGAAELFEGHSQPLAYDAFCFRFFAAYQVMANFFEIQMGFGISETVDPISQVTVPVLGQLQSLVVILIFIAIDGPSWVIRTLFYSFKSMPVLSDASKAVFVSSFNGIIDRMIYYMSSLFSIALSLALPIMLTLFLLSLSLGLLSKAAPQMNILMLGFPMQIAVGIITYYILIPVLVSNFMRILEYTISDVNNVITFLSGGTI